MKAILLPALALFALLAAGCDSPQRTVDQLRGEIDAYAAAPADDKAAKIEQGFQKLDAQITALRSSGKDVEARAWQQELDTLRVKYAAARVGAGLQGAKQALQGIGEAFREAGKSIGDAVRGADPQGD